MQINQRFIIAMAVITAPVAMGVALAMAGYSQSNGAWWTASVQLAVLGGITIMIYGVNLQALPAHSGKQWRSLPLIALQVGGGIAGAWMAAFGYGWQVDWLIKLGHALVLLAAVLFLTNLMLLFTGPGERSPRIPWEQRTTQQKVDRLAIPFTMISGLVVIIGTAIGVLLDYWRPDGGRWDLVWAHVMLLGFFFPMASGTSYHMLARWSGRDFAKLRLIGIHIITFIIGMPAMAIALAIDSDALLRIGAVSMAIAMTAWAINIIPVAWPLAASVRTGITLAIVFMVIGIGLGVMFAVDPVAGARLRSTHVVANLFGFAGLLISGFGYRYVPQLAGVSEMRWPGLRMPQVGIMALGCAIGMVFMALRMYGHLDAAYVLWPCLVGAFGMLLFAVNTLATFAPSLSPVTKSITLRSYDQH